MVVRGSLLIAEKLPHFLSDGNMRGPRRVAGLDLALPGHLSGGMERQKRAALILGRLRRRYPSPVTALAWSSPWELLVATMLAAQCTDERVNKTTPALFGRWPGIEEMAGASREEVETVIRPTGFFRSKAKNLTAAARMIVERFGGELPRSMDGLTQLPGVGRKTANIVLSNAFGVHEGIAVDTHVRRLAFRLGLTESTDPGRIELDLQPLFPRGAWGEINHLLVLFGREVCIARTPLCSGCPLSDICPRAGVHRSR
jgi:endonuclease III